MNILGLPWPKVAGLRNRSFRDEAHIVADTNISGGRAGEDNDTLVLRESDLSVSECRNAPKLTCQISTFNHLVNEMDSSTLASASVECAEADQYNGDSRQYNESLSELLGFRAVYLLSHRSQFADAPCGAS